MDGMTARRTQDQPIGLYLHIPFCRSKCPYCDFCSFPHPSGDEMAAYTHELTRRIRAAGAYMQARHPGGGDDRAYVRENPAFTGKEADGAYTHPAAAYTACGAGERPDGQPGGRLGADRQPVDTVYFGGGTPLLLPSDCVTALLTAVRESFALTPDVEITVEGNPAVADERLLAVWKAGGANRLSLGAQSAVEAELHALGRLHRWGDVERTVRDARAVGFAHINLDFMLGIPHQTPASLRDTLTRALALAPDHLSAYTLMLEEGTPFARRGREQLGLPADADEADDQAADFWEEASALLRGAGYEHYEISNYARPGCRSRHNLHTWQSHDFLGIGVAAHSLLCGTRVGQSRDLAGFLRGVDITAFAEHDSPAEREEEYIMLALRLADGIDDEEFRARFGYGFSERYGGKCERFIGLGLMERNGSRTRLTERGWAVSNTILSELI